MEPRYTVGKQSSGVLGGGELRKIKEQRSIMYQKKNMWILAGIQKKENKGKGREVWKTHSDLMASQLMDLQIWVYSTQK